MESTPTTDTGANTITRDIYILDIATGSSSNGVTLYVYTRTDAVSASYDSASTTIKTTLSLPLVGGVSSQSPLGSQWALASMAGNNNVIVVGTNQSPNAVVIQKSNFAVQQLGGFSPPMNVAAITTDELGYIAVTHGSFNSNNNGFILLDPTGALAEDGGGAEFSVNSTQAVLPATLP